MLISFFFPTSYLNVLKDGRYEKFKKSLWKAIAKTLKWKEDALDIPQHFELWEFWRDLKADPTGELKPFVDLALCMGLFPTSSASCARVFSFFKQIIRLEGNQGNASAQLQSASVRHRFNQVVGQHDYRRQFAKGNLLYVRYRVMPMVEIEEPELSEDEDDDEDDEGDEDEVQNE